MKTNIALLGEVSTEDVVTQDYVQDMAHSDELANDLGETVRLAVELDQIDDCINSAMESVSTLTKLNSALENAKHYGGIDNNASKAIMLCVEHMRARAGFKNSKLGLESFTSEDKQGNLKLAQESILDSIKSFIKAIIEAIKKAYEWVKGFLFGWKTASAGMSKAAARSEQKIKEVKDKTKKLPAEKKKVVEAIEASIQSKAKEKQKNEENALHLTENEIILSKEIHNKVNAQLSAVSFERKASNFEMLTISGVGIPAEGLLRMSETLNKGFSALSKGPLSNKYLTAAFDGVLEHVGDICSGYEHEAIERVEMYFKESGLSDTLSVLKLFPHAYIGQEKHADDKEILPGGYYFEIPESLDIKVERDLSDIDTIRELADFLSTITFSLKQAQNYIVKEDSYLDVPTLEQSEKILQMHRLLSETIDDNIQSSLMSTVTKMSSDIDDLFKKLVDIDDGSKQLLALFAQKLVNIYTETKPLLIADSVKYILNFIDQLRKYADLAYRVRVISLVAAENQNEQQE